MKSQIMKVIFSFTLLLFTSLALYGCMSRYYIKGECTTSGGDHSCTVEGGVEGEFFTAGPIKASDIQSVKILAEPVNIYLTNSSGYILLKIFNNSGLIAAKSFAYYRNGQYLHVEYPFAVSEWLNGFSGITAVNYEIRNMKYGYASSYVPGSGEKASLKVTAYYNNVPINSNTIFVPELSLCDGPMAWKFPQCGTN